MKAFLPLVYFLQRFLSIEFRVAKPNLFKRVQSALPIHQRLNHGCGARILIHIVASAGRFTMYFRLLVDRHVGLHQFLSVFE